MEIVLVAALDEGRAIGGDGDLLWHLPADLKHFKSVTVGHPIIMGRRTYESIGKPLPGRKNIVLTRQSDFEAPGCVVHSDLEAALKEANRESQKVMILGGATLYAQTLPMADRLILTVVHEHYQGDTHFPYFDSDQWTVVESWHHEADERNPASMTFVELVAAVEEPRRVIDDGPRGLPEILKNEGPAH